MGKYYLTEALIFALLIIAWQMGVLSLARIGEIMTSIGTLFLVIVVLSLLGIRVLSGDASVFQPLNKIVGIQSLRDKPSIFYILQVLGLGVIPIAAGVFFQAFSQRVIIHIE